MLKEHRNASRVDRVMLFQNKVVRYSKKKKKELVSVPNQMESKARQSYPYLRQALRVSCADGWVPVAWLVADEEMPLVVEA